MRITRDILIRTARETAQKRALGDPGLVAAYLTGSLRGEDPFLGGSTDIDIVLVHERIPKRRREVEAVTPDVHLDILHVPRSDYEKPKELRLDPWLGPELYDPLPLYGTQHFFEFVQAGVRDKFNDPANILARARCSAARGRQVWSGLLAGSMTGPAPLLDYFKSVRHAANSLALLQNQPPLAERRLLLQFPPCAAAVGKPALTGKLMDLLGPSDLDLEALKACLTAWEKDFVAAAGRTRTDSRLSPARLPYYKRAFELQLQGETPYALLWGLLLTWTLSAASLPASRQAAWDSACRGMGLTGPSFTEQVSRLDAFLDEIEEILENWKG